MSTGAKSAAKREEIGNAAITCYSEIQPKIT
jgi:hypothetical protein